MRVLFVFIYCYFSCSVFAQQLPDPLLSSISGGTAYSTVQHDAFGVLVNPAAVSRAGQMSAGLYSERRFALRDLQQLSGLLQFPFQRGGLGMQVDYSGSPRMNETTFGLAYGMPLGSQMDAGIRFRHYTLNMPGYVRSSTIWAEVGFLFKLTDQVITGFSLSRSTRTRLAADEPELMQVFRMGIGYQLSAKVLLVTDWLKQTNRALIGTCMLLYSFDEGLRLRAGWNLSTGQPVLGAGMSWKAMRSDIMMAYHPLLGFTPMLQFLWQSVNQKKEQTEK
jgi:hypothetical protein